MFKSRSTLAFAMLIILTVLSWGNTSYAVDCARATIKKVGTNPTLNTGASPYMVQLSCSKESAWEGISTFYLSTDLGDSGLATLLTAYSMNKTLWVRALGSKSGSIITVIYMND
ncbi:hypothetical protein [Desulfogranum marinum]|uniref:hypothetical protein n=1 Tax=Desulfogranum marinum TaxID=453220 RepID=UPI0029C646BC|nr:hypothetical protein [Desulfogranum marinum]